MPIEIFIFDKFMSYQKENTENKSNKVTLGGKI